MMVTSVGLWVAVAVAFERKDRKKSDLIRNGKGMLSACYDKKNLSLPSILKAC